MNSPLLDQVARRHAPTYIGQTVVGATSTAAVDLSAHKGKILVFTASVSDVCVNCAGASVAAATLSMFRIANGSSEEFLITDGHTHFRFIAVSASSAIAYASTGD